MQREVTITYLESTSPDELRAKRLPNSGINGAGEVAVVRVPKPFPELNRFFYTTIGGDWCWHSRLSWTYADWMNYLDRQGVETWMATVAGVPAGYCELETQDDGSVQIAFFGIVRQYTGRGLGGHLLSLAIERAWQMDAKRVWLHTCTLDDPRALPNYQARGLRIYKQETKLDNPPDQLGPWPGAR